MLNFEFQGKRKLRDEVTSSRLNAMLEEIRRVRPLAGRGINIQQEGNGTRISALDAFAPSIAFNRPRPWDLITTDSTESSVTLKVNPGTINGILPSNFADQFTVSKNSTSYAKLLITTDGRSFTSVEIEIDSSPPSTQVPEKFATPSEVEWLFGVYYEGVAFNLTGGENITATSRQWLVTSAPIASPGESPFEIYFQVA
jgi:hypothetical protein